MADSELQAYANPATALNWKFRTLKAEILVRQRLNTQALDLLKPEPPASLATSDIAVWRKMTQGTAYVYLADFPDADRLLNEAQALAEKYHPELLGEVALRKGTRNFWSDNLAESANEYRIALAAAREKKDAFLEAASLGSLGVIAAKQEHYDESVDWDKQALQLAQSIRAQGSATKTLGNIAWSYFELGDYEHSLSLFRQARDSAAKAGNVGDQIVWGVNVGAVELYLQDYAEAETEIRGALQLAGQINQKAQIVESQEALARIALEQSRIDAAAQENNEALRLYRKDGDHLGELSSTIVEGRIANGRGERDAAERLLKSVIGDRAATPSLRWEAEARLASVYADEARPADAEREFRAASDTMEAARSSIQDEELRISFLTNATELYEDYADFLVSQKRGRDALRLAVETRARTLVEGLGLAGEKQPARAAEINWNEVARQRKSIILYYWIGSRRSYLWAITPSGEFRLFDLPPEQQIDGLVRSYNNALLGPGNVLETSSATGRDLYNALIAPAESMIPKGSRLVIVPDGSLCALNFETLVAPKPTAHYWIEDATISYSDSLLLLAATRSSAVRRGGKLLLVGDPVSPSTEFPALPQAASEMSSVEKYFVSADTKILAGRDATAQAYLASGPGQFSYIHFVAHGISSRARPLESAVILSRDGDSFKLYGRDVIKRPLNAQLVTISACYGVGSRNYSREGLVGLSWAFLRAGAHGVIAALWDVNDASTANLMDHLYGELGKGKDPAAALRDAKLALLHSGTIYQRPFYWAPFQFYMGS